MAVWILCYCPRCGKEEEVDIEYSVLGTRICSSCFDEGKQIPLVSKEVS